MFTRQRTECTCLLQAVRRRWAGTSPTRERLAPHYDVVRFDAAAQRAPMLPSRLCRLTPLRLLADMRMRLWPAGGTGSQPQPTIARSIETGRGRGRNYKLYGARPKRVKPKTPGGAWEKFYVSRMWGGIKTWKDQGENPYPGRKGSGAWGRMVERERERERERDCRSRRWETG